MTLSILMKALLSSFPAQDRTMSWVRDKEVGSRVGLTKLPDLLTSLKHNPPSRQWFLKCCRCWERTGWGQHLSRTQLDRSQSSVLVDAVFLCYLYSHQCGLGDLLLGHVSELFRGLFPLHWCRRSHPSLPSPILSLVPSKRAHPLTSCYQSFSSRR